jgi:hypothetical protein
MTDEVMNPTPQEMFEIEQHGAEKYLSQEEGVEVSAS